MDGDLIALVNKLQDTFNAIGGEAVDLPQIVVVGSQSSGKSSVLETIVGRDFLPRGSGIVTRRPLVLQLINQPSPSSSSSSSSSSPSEYGEFLHLPNRRFIDFAEIKTEIESETMRVAGVNKGISRSPIHLKIHSDRVLNLTLVDLPGLTKIPVGDQPSDIERQIRSLVSEFISRPNSVILAVSPANVDLANSESLKLSRSFDPQGKRTIGVLTKLDLMDFGTNALDILTGRVYPLKLGFIGTVNRSQHDINTNLSLQKSLEKEEEFFHSHPAYKNIAQRCGTKFLAKTLNQVLMSHIRDKLPDMKARLNTLIGQTQQELSAYGDYCTSTNPKERGLLVLKLMTQFVKDFVSSIDGNQDNFSTKEICGGARIYYIFNEVFGQNLQMLNPMENLSNADIKTSIRNSTGTRSSMFIPEAAFDLLIKPKIKLLEPPGLRCVEMVYEELMKICHNCTNSELRRYPKLHAQLIEVVSELLRERLGPTSDYVQSLIAIQAAYINTSHPEFMPANVMARATRSNLVGESHQPNGLSSHRRHSESDDDAEDSSSPDEGDDGASERSTFAANNTTNYPRNYQQQKDRRLSAPADHSNLPGSRMNGSAITNRIVSDGRLNVSPSLNDSQKAYPQGSRSQESVWNPTGSAKDSFLNYFFGGSAVGLGNGMMYQHMSRSTIKMSRQDHKQQPNSSFSQSLNPLTVSKKTSKSVGTLKMNSVESALSEATNEDNETLPLTEREQMEINLIKSLMLSYFEIVRQTIQDMVPKAVMHYLVNHVKEGVQNRLVTNLYREELFEKLLVEDEGLKSERDRVKTLLDAYKEAFKTLSQVL
ncbi:dynamin-3 [Phakopsora pachyrhizi]|nr:dynamin-3 [Phakopsora pachyrhizi]